jgi:hypothetical protein
MRQTLGNYYPAGGNRIELSPSRKLRASQGSIKAKSMRNITKTRQMETGTPKNNAHLNLDMYKSGMNQTVNYNPVEYAKQANLKYVGSTQGNGTFGSNLKASTNLRRSPSSYLRQPKKTNLARSLSRRVLPTTNKDNMIKNLGNLSFNNLKQSTIGDGSTNNTDNIFSLYKNSKLNRRIAKNSLTGEGIRSHYMNNSISNNIIN